MLSLLFFFSFLSFVFFSFDFQFIELMWGMDGIHCLFIRNFASDLQFFVFCCGIIRVLICETFNWQGTLNFPGDLLRLLIIC